MSRMRVAMVHSSFMVRGGAERYIRDLTRGLLTRGHEVAVFCRPSPHAEPVDRHVGARLSERAFRLPKLHKVVTHLADLLDPTGLRPRDLGDFAPDVVHVHNWQGLGILPVARLSRAYPTCHSVHDMAICDPNNALGNLGRSGALDALLGLRSAWIGRRLRRTLLLFSAERNRALVRRRARGGRRVPDRVVPLGVVAPGQGQRWPTGRRDTFLFLGALSPHKGIDLLLRAWEAGHAQIDGTLLIGGDGPLRAEVERVAGELPSVRYLGYLDEAGKESALRQAGWLVFPSQGHETFGLACAEALIAGRPLIASAVAAPPMASGGSTLVFDSAEDLRRTLARAAHMPDPEYQTMSASAATDGGRLDWEDHVDAVIGVYESLLAARSASPAREGFPR